MSPGGGRRIVAPERSAFAALRAAQRGESEPVVAVCSACGQPMVGSGTPIGWTLRSPAGALTTEGGAWQIDGAAATPEQAAAWIDRWFAPPAPPGDRRFGPAQFLLLVFMLAPFFVWVFSVAFVSFFLYRFPETYP